MPELVAQNTIFWYKLCVGVGQFGLWWMFF